MKLLFIGLNKTVENKNYELISLNNKTNFINSCNYLKLYGQIQITKISENSMLALAKLNYIKTNLHQLIKYNGIVRKQFLNYLAQYEHNSFQK